MRKYLLFFIASMWLVTGSHAANRIAGKNLPEAFSDERIVSFLSSVRDGNYPKADALRQAGLDINTIGTDGISPLLWVMGNTLDISKIEYLLKAGANPNYIDKSSQFSAMYLASGGNRADILELLLQNKGDPNLFGPRGETLLMVAAAQFREKNMELLLTYGANINLNDHLNETVANKAAGYGRFDWVAQFLEQGLTYNLQDLAKDVEIRQVPRGSEQQRWKDKVIEMLKERGVKFPAFIPCHPPGDPRRIEANCKK